MKRHFLRRWTEWPTRAWIYMETISAGFYQFSSCIFSKALYPSTSPKAVLQCFQDTLWPVLSECWDWQAFFCPCCDRSINTSSEPGYSSRSVERSGSALIRCSCKFLLLLVAELRNSALSLHGALFQQLNSLRGTDYCPFWAACPIKLQQNAFWWHQNRFHSCDSEGWLCKGTEYRPPWSKAAQLKAFLFLPLRFPNSSGGFK